MSIVLVGGGGSGLSGVGLMLNEFDFDIIVIDSSESLYTTMLQQVGVQVIIGHGKYKLQSDDIVIFSQAVENSIEVTEAKGKCNVQPLSYSQFIAQISKYFKTLAIAGTHGKSTTSAMAIEVFSSLSDKFAIGMLGAQMPKFGNQNYVANENLKPILYDLILASLSGEDHPLKNEYYFIYEADEFSKRLVMTQNYAGVITNIDFDHIEIYPTQRNYDQIFLDFINSTPNIFVLEQESSIKNFSARNNINLKTYPMLEFDFENIEGVHNQKNASLVFHLITHLEKNIDKNLVQKILENFGGIGRRMEKIGEKNGNIVFSDYAHHPVELESVYDFLSKKFSDKKKIIIFQPHQASRVLKFWDEFEAILNKFDEKYLMNLYPAREKFEDIQNQVFEKKQIKIEDYKHLDELFANYLNTKILDTKNIEKLLIDTTDSVIVFAGAGSIDEQVRKIFALSQ